MKNTHIYKSNIYKSIYCVIVALTMSAATTFTSCTTLNYNDINAVQDERRIYLYGETHGQEIILQKELELWETYYNDYGYRHLFVELGYGTAQYLNVWMQSDSDTILNMIYDNWDGTLSHTESNYNFYKAIKTNCPETIFHGTDVGHQFHSTDGSYLTYLENQGMKESEEYRIASENIEQAKKYYEKNADYDTEAFRENAMIENFIREFSKLSAKEKVMGIYGSAHIKLGEKNWGSKKVKNMATQLNEYYIEKEGIGVYTFSLTGLKK